MKFNDLDLNAAIGRAIADLGYTDATPIQAQTIPHTLAGRDVLGSAQTGTGKTAAFALPTLHRLAESQRPGGKTLKGGRSAGKTTGFNPRALVLCPTRELAVQIADSFDNYGRHLKLHTVMVFGGVNQGPQVKALRRGVDVIIATPGRLMDLMEQGHIDLSGIETVVLDEADRMLDMGFIHDIRKITARVPDGAQTLFFSATMPPAIQTLAGEILNDPARVEIEPEHTTAENIQQYICFCHRGDKLELLSELLDHLNVERCIVFSRTKANCDRVVKLLKPYGHRAEVIHGNMRQNARQRALDAFRSGKVRILIATDVAARGIDVKEVSHVINYDLPDDPESYVHRIGRTARAGAEGVAVSFCADHEAKPLALVQRLIGDDKLQPLEVKGLTRRPLRNFRGRLEPRRIETPRKGPARPDDAGRPAAPLPEHPQRREPLHFKDKPKRREDRQPRRKPEARASGKLHSDKPKFNKPKSEKPKSDKPKFDTPRFKKPGKPGGGAAPQASAHQASSKKPHRKGGGFKARQISEANSAGSGGGGGGEGAGDGGRKKVVRLRPKPVPRKHETGGTFAGNVDAPAGGRGKKPFVKKVRGLKGIKNPKQATRHPDDDQPTGPRRSLDDKTSPDAGPFGPSKAKRGGRPSSRPKGKKKQ